MSFRSEYSVSIILELSESSSLWASMTCDVKTNSKTHNNENYASKTLNFVLIAVFPRNCNFNLAAQLFFLSHAHYRSLSSIKYVSLSISDSHNFLGIYEKRPPRIIWNLYAYLRIIRDILSLMIPLYSLVSTKSSSVIKSQLQQYSYYKRRALSDRYESIFSA